MTGAYQDLSLEKIAGELQKAERVLILFHRHPDPDCIGSAFALAEILIDMGKEALCSGEDPVPERLRFLTESSRSEYRPAEKLTGFKPDLVISVDVASPAQLGTVLPVLEGQGLSVRLMIDHHERGTRFADGFVQPSAAASAEIVMDLYRILRERYDAGPLTLCAAQNLYAGIAGDTGGFRYSNTTEQTHLRAAELHRFPIRHDEICRKLFDAKSQAQLRAEKEALSVMRYCLDGEMTIASLTLARKEQLGLTDEDLGTMIDVIRTIDGVRVACVIREEPDNRYRVSMRSTDTVDVAAICTEHGGGGHARAAGCTARAESLAEMETILIREVGDRLKK